MSVRALCCFAFAANPDAYSFQPENALKLKPWDHSTQDTTLLDLIPFLQMVQEVHVDVSSCGYCSQPTSGGQSHFSWSMAVLQVDLQQQYISGSSLYWEGIGR